MNAAKRRRDTSTAATLTENQSNDSRASSFIQSSPLRYFQRTKHPQHRPAKRLGLRISRKHTGSSVPDSHTRPLHRNARFSSIAASHVDVAQEDGTGGEQEEGSDPDEVIMCVDMKERGTVGCCYYESSTGSLHLVEDIQCGGLNIIDTCEYIPAKSFYKD